MHFLKSIAAALALTFTAAALPQATQAADTTIRIGYQKYGTLILLKGKGTLEKKLGSLGVKVVWTEFPSGPPLLEAINVGAIDFGSTGETPPIFAQAAGAPLVYVAHEPPAPKGEAILVPKDSPIKTVADLKGKKIAFNKGSNVHYLLVKALEKAGIKYSEIEPMYLAPADARAAFERRSVDAWVIWDPYQAAAEVATQARTLADGEGLAPNHQFYLGAQKFVEANPAVIDALVDSVAEVDRWGQANPKALAEELSPGIGIPVPILEIALKRQSYGIKPLDAGVVAQQQAIADTFFQLGLIPKAINITTVVRKAGS